MPNIREYKTPSLGLRPSETGVEATAGAARRIGGFYNQAGSTIAAAGTQMSQAAGDLAASASTIEEEGRRIGTSIQDVGEAAVKYQEHQEVSHGALAFASLTDGLTKTWNGLAKDADPNDPTLARRFMETQVEPELDKLRQGFITTEGQKWAEARVDALRTHLFRSTSADMSTMAGIAVQKNTHEIATTMSNTAINDPSSVPFLLDSVDHSIAGIVSSSPTLRAVDAARISTEVSEKTKANIVKFGAIVAVQKSGDPEKTAEEWTRKYPQFIDGAEAKMLAANARQQLRSRNYDFEQNRRREKEVIQDRSTELTNQYLIDVRSKDPRLSGDPTAVKILNDTNLTKADKNNLLNYIDRQFKPETDARLSSETYIGLLRNLRAPDADPDQIMQDAWDARMTDPGKHGSLSKSDFEDFRKEVVARKTPEGAALAQSKAEFFKGVAPLVDKSNPLMGKVDQDGKMNLYRMEWDLNRKIEEYRKAGKNPYDLLDPSKPDFFGLPAALAPYQKPLQDSIRDQVRKLSGGNAATAPATAPPMVSREVNKVYPTPRGDMKWTKSGWVSP